jgi:hypothetical protein
LKSKALQQLLEGCLQQGASSAEAAPLAQLLEAVAHPNVPQHLTRALATTATSLGQLAAADALAPTPAAKRSAAAALALVLRGMPRAAPPAKAVEGPASKLKRLGGELGRQEARLASTQQPKELCKIYASVLELLCGQLDVLRPGGASGGATQAPELAAALKPLEELRSALNARLQVRVWGALRWLFSGSCGGAGCGCCRRCCCNCPCFCCCPAIEGQLGAPAAATSAGGASAAQAGAERD